MIQHPPLFFQVTDTELQAMTKQAHHILIPPDIQSETVIESSQSEQSGDERGDLVGETGVYRPEGVVRVSEEDEGVEKYELQSQTLEQEVSSYRKNSKHLDTRKICYN